MNVKYFIKKFKAIPEENWCTAAYRLGDRCCVLGHCGFYTLLLGELTSIHNQAPEGVALSELFLNAGLSPTNINDGVHSGYQQPTPKARILAALRDIQSK